jgi:hypothetical protein
MYGKTHSKETREKLSQALRGHSVSEETRLKISQAKLSQSGEVTAQALHLWLRRWYPKKNVCEHCGREGKTDYASITGHVYSRNLADYAEVCPSCHLKMDYASGARASQAGQPKPRGF